MSLNEKEWDWGALQRQGGLLLGAEHRLQIAVLLASADPEELYAARIASAAGVDRTEARREIARFQSAGLLMPASSTTPRDSSRRGRPASYLKRLNEPTWEVLVELARRLERN